ncbi:uncharacterized protein LOC121429695 [Lytechinus variegatus]|uniref:uncharacterized protein LOC121429695 n=1 Tax=Lytechinus variegatus TaxID=7654 RepID=UPI001BB26BB2|nr:uncharacterized protein LOC121429695 [Lytechinus variegatus]
MKFILVEHGIKKDTNPLMLWLKSTLWEYADQFPQVMCHVHSVLKKTKSQQPPKAKELPKSKTPPTLQESSKPLEPLMPQEPLKGKIEEIDDMHWDFADDQELLDMADTLVSSSELGVKAHLTTAGDLLKVSQHSQESSSNPGLEGWQKSWEEPPPNTQPMFKPNIHWLKNDLVYGLYTKQGSKKVLKPIMNFSPPPLISQIQGALPPMLSFFTTTAFFWRPVGVMQLKVPCPNRDCPAQPGYSLIRHGYGSIARTVYGIRFPYTLLTERLSCNHCKDKRKSAGDDDKRQYSWNASSLSILQQLAPAVKSMFPAVIVGKRAIDKEVVTLHSDRVNSISMTKVYRVLEMGHSKWYAERRDLYQTLLFKAHSADTSEASQRGILSFIKAPGSYMPPISQSVLPSPRTLCRAHMIMEMERMSVYRQSILSVTGEILCIDGTKQILKKVYGDGQDTMHFLTSILNEWGQFVTAVVVASESEECYQRMARGLCSRFRRANAPAPKVMYTDNNCCRDGGTSWMESLFQDWVRDGMLCWL